MYNYNYSLSTIILVFEEKKFLKEEETGRGLFKELAEKPE
jgi:hypothetical protein